MNLKRKWKNLIVIVLTLCLNLASAPGMVSAAASSESGQESQTLGGELSVKGTNTLGNLLAEPVEEEMQKQEENNGCNIFSIEVEGNVAVADFETTENAELLVAVYDESGVEMVASGSTSVYAGDKMAAVDIEIETMPQYFYLRGFLIDPDSFRPICTAYESPNYTKDMQDFFASTAGDYQQDRVLNFDESENTNFAVYTDETILLETDTPNVNQITVVDEERKIYQIANADETVLGLQEGDIFSGTMEDGSILVVKVQSVSIDGTTVTVTGQADVDIKEVFSYVKIEETMSMEEADIDASTCEEGVVYNGLVDETEEPEAQASVYGISPYASTTVTKTMDYTFVDKKLGSGDAAVSLNGSLKLRFDNTFEYYLTLSNTYISLKMDYSGNLTVDIAAYARGSVTIGTLQFSALGVVNITFTPKILFEANAKLNVTGSLRGTVGFSCSLQEGMKNLTTAPEFKASLTAEADLYVGIELKPAINLLSEHFAEAGMTATVGGKVTGKLLVTTETSNDVRHECSACVDGDVFGKYGVSFRVKLLDQDWLTFTYNAIDKTVKLLDFYYSVDKNEFGFTACPYLKYLVTVTVKNNAGTPVSGAAVNGSYTTNASGQVSLYLACGNQTITASKDGYGTTKDITVSDRAQSVVLTLSGQGGSDKPFDGTNSGEIRQISLGGDHSAAVMKDGSLYTWGKNNYGQLGDKTVDNSVIPIKISDSNIAGYLKDNSVAKAALGEYHSAAITKEGSLYVWGYNSDGQIGNGTTVNRNIPIKVMDNIEKVSLGRKHSAAITKDGSLFVWGDNYNGQVGDGTSTDRNIPVKIMDNVEEVSLGGDTSALVTKDGKLYVWGSNTYGQLGDGTEVKERHYPVKIMDNVDEVSLGNDNSAVVTKDGKLYVWGSNTYGQLGDGTKELRRRPVMIAQNIAHVSLGIYYSAAITRDGGLYIWGGQYGSTPVKIMDNVVQVALGYYHNATVTKEGSLYIWGSNTCGQLGDGTTTGKSNPTQIQIYDHTPSLHSLSLDEEDPQAEVYSSIAAYSESAAGTKTVTYTDLKPEEYYNFYSMKYKGNSHPLGADNLLYIAQVKTDENGSFTLNYTPDEDYATPTDFVVALSQTDISEAEVTMPALSYTGKDQYVNPLLIYNEQRLAEGTDYEISGTYQVNEVGEYSFTLTGIGAFTGTHTVTYSVEKKDCKTLDVDAISPVVFHGAPMMPEVVVRNGDTVLEEGRDYTVTYQNNTGTGIGIAVISGEGNYEGSQVCLFDIEPCELTEDMISQIPEQGYTGQAVTPELLLPGLEEGTDYTVSYTDNIEIGTATAVITGCGNYTGSIRTTFTIGKASQSFEAELTENSIVQDEVCLVVIKNAIGDISYRSEDERIARVDENGIVTGVWKGTTKIIVTADGNEYYKDAAVELEVEVTKKEAAAPSDQVDCRTLTIHEIPSVTYNGEPQRPAVTVSDGTEMLTEGTDYTVEYQNNVNAGTGIVRISGLGKYEGSQLALFEIEPCGLSEAMLSRIPEQTYTGQPLTPEVALGELVSGADYRVEYSDNIKLGTAKVTVTGRGNYTGILSAAFAIVKKQDISSGNDTPVQTENKTPGKIETPSDSVVSVPPKKASISSLKLSGGKKLKVKWKKVEDASGYQIQCSLKKTFRSGIKKTEVKKGSKTAATLKRLKSGKRYFVRIRAYKTVQTDGKTVKLYGAWSKVGRSKKIK